jgi:hypothetical protein
MTQTELEQTGNTLFNDGRRGDASLLSDRISHHASALIGSPDSAEIFDYRYAAVSGSISRKTHLPNSPDFDIGLWPAECHPVPVFNELPKRTQDEYQDALGQVASGIAARLIDDNASLTRLAGLFGVSTDAIRSTLRKNPILKKRIDSIWQMTAKFKVGQHSLMEVAVGHHPWHYIGLKYNAYWNGQLDQLTPESRQRALMNICLLKHLLTQQQLYGHIVGVTETNLVTLTSRRLEQLVVRHAFAGSEAPLRAAMNEVCSSRDQDLWILLPGAPDFILDDLRLDRKQLQLLRNEELDVCRNRWRAFQEFARHITDSESNHVN